MDVNTSRLECAYEERPLDGVPLMYTKHCAEFIAKEMKKRGFKFLGPT